MSTTADPQGMHSRMPRQQVLLGVEICGFGGGTPTRHRIKDLSTTGARVDRAAMLRPGSTVLVSVGVLEAVGATVVWVTGEAAGLRFAQPIDVDAARSKALVAPNSQLSLKLKAMRPEPVEPEAGPAVTAGWVADLRNPYRRVPGRR